MPDTHMLQVVRFEAATVEGPEGDRDYVKLAGYGPDGTWCKAIMFGAAAPKVEERLREEFASAPGRQVVLCEGRWRVQGESMAFVASRMEVVVGPAAEVTLARLDAAKALGRADKLRRMALASGKPVPEEMLAAYREMEAFVSTFTGQAPPSVTSDADLADVALIGLEDLPEEAALVRLETLAAGGADMPVPVLRVAKAVDTGQSPVPAHADVTAASAVETPEASEGAIPGEGPVEAGSVSAVAREATSSVAAPDAGSETVPESTERAPSTVAPEGADVEAPVGVAAAAETAPPQADVPAVRPVPRVAPPRFVPGRRPVPGRPMPAPEAGSSPKM